MHGKTSEIRHDGQDDLRGPARRLHRDALPLARRGAGERPRLPRGVGLDGRRGRHGPAPPRAAPRGRAVPPREHPHHRRKGPPPQLPRPRREGQHQAPPREGGPRRAALRGRGRGRHGLDHGRAKPRLPRSARCSAPWPRGARPRTRWWASPGRCARARCRSARRAPSTPAAPAATARAPSTSRPWPRSWSRPAACAWPSTATARPAAPAAAPTCSRRSACASTRPWPSCSGALDAIGWTFLFAPTFHAVDPPRGLPAHARWGCGRRSTCSGRSRTPPDRRARWSACRAPSIAPFVARCLQRLGTKRAWVVNGSGLDELTLAGPTSVAALEGDTVRTFTVTPEDAGLASGAARGAARRRPAGERGDRARGARRERRGRGGTWSS